MTSRTDSAGVPWAGRTLHAHPFAGDTGEPDPALLAALAQVAAAPFDSEAHRAVVSALTGVRLYAPVLPTAVEHTTDASGLVHDNKSEMAMVRLAAADGRQCTPAFTDIPTLSAWHGEARPVPTQAERLGAAAVEEGAQLVVINAGADNAFLLRRPALWAWLQGEEWTPGWANAEVAGAVSQVVAGLPWVDSVTVGVGSAHVVTTGPEVGLTFRVNHHPGAAQVHELNDALGSNDAIVELVDSLTVSFAQV